MRPRDLVAGPLFTSGGAAGALTFGMKKAQKRAFMCGAAGAAAAVAYVLRNAQSDDFSLLHASGGSLGVSIASCVLGMRVEQARAFLKHPKIGFVLGGLLAGLAEAVGTSATLAGELRVEDLMVGDRFPC